MGRSRITPVKQPDEVSCGPASLKTVLRMFDMHIPMNHLISICKTNRNGTTTAAMIRAIKKLNLSVSYKTKATLKHIKANLKKSSKPKFALMISYLYCTNNSGKPDIESGHWAVVASYSEKKDKIILFDSYTGKRKSYPWKHFRKHWLDYEQKRTVDPDTKRIRYRKVILPQPLFIVSK